MKKKLLNLFIVICFIIVIILGIDIGLTITGNEELKQKAMACIQNITPFSNYKSTILTEENYEEMISKMKDNMQNDDEVYYLLYASTNYILEDGLAAAFTNPDDNTAMYKRIYGKTIQQLINEGKQLMKDNNITLEEYKQSLESLSDIETE